LNQKPDAGIVTVLFAGEMAKTW